MTAGYLVGQVANSTWEEFFAERMFKPLGTTNSNFSVEASQQAADFAQPYRIKDEKVEKIPFRNLDAIGLAGSINSCVNDILKWIQFQLNKGKIGDKQLVSESEMQNMQTPYMFISFPMESNERSHSKRMSLILKGSLVIVQNFQWKMAWLRK
jgi:CubicO group peptidase (beta-lactamase class C family)